MARALTLLRTLLVPLAGPIGWAAAFSLVYGLHGVGCANGWNAVSVAGVDAARAAMGAAWLASLAALVALVAWTHRAGRAGADPFLARLTRALAWIGLVGTAYSLSPLLAVAACV